tara:strand:- start:407 stop:697 length:291 start_codon:yes stop_codon:yes gene_type:complete
MALKHGNKTYLQILLDPNRAKLVMQQSGLEGIRATAWIRNAVYAQLQRELPSSVYKAAEAKDHAEWRESVRRRVDGRAPNIKEKPDEDQNISHTVP